MKIWKLAVATCLVVLVAGVGYAQDEAKLYFLKFTHDAPKELYLTTGDSGEEPEVFWYLVYTVENADPEDHEIYLEVTAETGKGVRYRDGYHPLALERIRKQTGNQAVVRLKDGTTVEGRVELGMDRTDVDEGTSSRSLKNDEVEEIRYKLWGHKEVTTPEEISSVEVRPERRPLGKPYKIARPILKAGETRQCVAIFPRLDAEMDRLTISILGLTNDILVEPTEPHTRKVTERLYQIVYERPGDEFHPSLDKISFVKEGWVDRERIIKTDLKSPKEE